MGGQYHIPGDPAYKAGVPWHDKRVRQALNMSINRGEMLDAIFQGKGKLVYVSCYDPTLEGWNPAWATQFESQYGYNPERAKALLTEAGYPPGKLKINVLGFQSPGEEELPQVAESLSLYFHEVGVVAHHWGLDRPLYVQYGIFLGNALRGDFGNSWLWQGYTVMGLVAQRLPATLELAGIALAISLVIALPIGVISAVMAVMKDTPVDSMAKTIALLGQSLPAFWLGIVLMWIFAVKLGWLPPSGNEGLQSIILPAITLGWFQVAAVMRLGRSSMLEVLDSEFVKLARIKGLPEWKVIWKHCSIPNSSMSKCGVGSQRQDLPSPDAFAPVSCFPPTPL